MSKKFDYSMPYPVLGLNDDVFPLLGEDCIVMDKPIKDASEYTFGIELNQHNKKISELVEMHIAEYACEVICQETLYRHCFKSNTNRFEIKLNRKSVRGHIDFKCFIAVKVPIENYRNEEFNEDYQGYGFKMEIGDILAVFPEAYYNTSIKYDKLYAAGSFMQIIDAGDDKEKPGFNIEGDKIDIELPGAMFRQYENFGNGDFMEVIHSSIVYNALVYALMNIDVALEDGKGRLWADAIDQRVQSEAQFNGFDLHNLDIQQIYELADILLGNPYQRMFNCLEKLNQSNVEED